MVESKSNEIPTVSKLIKESENSGRMVFTGRIELPNKDCRGTIVEERSTIC